MIPADDRKAVLPRRSAQGPREVFARLGVGALKQFHAYRHSPLFTMGCIP